MKIIEKKEVILLPGGSEEEIEKWVQYYHTRGYRIVFDGRNPDGDNDHIRLQQEFAFKPQNLTSKS